MNKFINIENIVVIGFLGWMDCVK